MQQVKCIDGGIVALSGATSSVVSAGSVLRRPAPLPAPCPAPTRSRTSLRAAPYGPGLHPFLGHVIRPCEQHPLALIRLVFEESVNHTNAKAASHAVALEGRWPPPVRAATVKGGDKVYHRGGGIVYHRHDEKELNWEPGRVR